jgi:hypothetical protein
LSGHQRSSGRHLDEDRENAQLVLHTNQIEQNGVVEAGRDELAVRHRTLSRTFGD